MKYIATMNIFFLPYPRAIASILVLGLCTLGFVAGVPGSGSVYANNDTRICGPAQDEEEDDCIPVDLPEPEERTDPALGDRGADGLIHNYVNPFINFLAIAVGIIVTISIVVGGIQYSASADDPQKVAKAKDRIINAIIALLAFLFLYAFLQWLVPGGFLN